MKADDYQFLDSFHRALQSFKLVWSLKKWKSDSLEQLCWCTFHFVRLYVSSFAFQAHVQRAQARAEGEAGSEGKGEGGKEKNVQLFPRGRSSLSRSGDVGSKADEQARLLLRMLCISTNLSTQLPRYCRPASVWVRWEFSDTCLRDIS